MNSNSNFTNRPSWILARTTYNQYISNPLKDCKKVIIETCPESIELLSQGYWIKLNNIWHDGENIEGFFYFNQRNINYDKDIGVFFYSQRKKLPIQIFLVKIGKNIWYSPYIV